MKRIIIALILLVSLNTFGQHLDECGTDNDPKLTRVESDFLNQYINQEQRKNFDFTGKKMIFVTGTSAHKMGTKSDYFDQVKKWNDDGNKIATGVFELDEQEKIVSGGYDAIITYWVKTLSKKRKKKILNELRNNR